MRYELGQNGAAVQEAPPIAAGTVSTKEIPYDYVASFKLTGKVGNRVQDVITISTEGTFVAVTVGYSFEPQDKVLAGLTAVPAPFTTLFGALFTGPPTTDPGDAFRALVIGLLMKSPGIHFRYSIVDSGSGRELQNRPVHSLAGLGSADGNRPFRPFARPVAFVPRATIRIEIEELSEGPFFRDGTLQIVLHGYKRLGE